MKYPASNKNDTGKQEINPAPGKDISELKKAEEEIKDQAHFIKSITDIMPVVVTVVALPSRDIIYTNRDVFVTLGFDVDQIGKMSFKERTGLFHPDDLPVIQLYYDRFISLKDNEENMVEYRVKNSKGDWVFLSFRGKVFRRDKDGNVTEVLMIAQDMTEQKKTAKERLTAITDLAASKEAEKIKEDFISIASHELKTPVTSIKLYTEMLEEKMTAAGNTEDAEMMQKLNAQVDRLTNLIKDLLDTTRIFEGKLQLRLEDFDLNELAQERITELQGATPRHKLVFDANTLPLINADRERIGQVITNLITNAVKYSPSGGDVIITTQLSKKGVMLSVKDKGIGMSPEIQDRVFERFYRVPDTRIQTFPGLGLGLYISSEIVKRHGGTIGVESKLGDGAKFYFTLPLNTDTHK